MSGSHPVNPATGQGGADPSMEDILASIRRILSEDEAPGARPAPASQPALSHPPAAALPPPPSSNQPPAVSVARPDAVLALDETMLVREPQRPPSHSPGNTPLAALGSFMSAPTQPDARIPPPPAPEPMPAAVLPMIPVVTAAPMPPVQAPPSPPATFEKAVPMAPADHTSPSTAGEPSLVAPEAAAAASASMGSLLRSLSAERHTPVHHGGPSIEDIVRDEMRPMLKLWLDTHLPGMVERLVRSEIERMAGHAKS